ncbi:competence protein ComK [Pseudogracilibacillus auburnensis]|nr:competence protein ComK [Pseudogracilibacillus auburnensis]
MWISYKHITRIKEFSQKPGKSQITFYNGTQLTLNTFIYILDT